MLEKEGGICYTHGVAMRTLSLRGRSQIIGKNLKGRECGKGICQRKDGLYLARFFDKAGRTEC